MGKKSTNNQKTIKSNKLASLNNFFNKQSNTKASNLYNKHTKSIDKNIIQEKNTIFDKQLSTLYQRNNLIKQKINKKILSIAEPRFLYNTNKNLESTNQIDSANDFDMIDVLLKDEKDPKPTQISIKDNSNRKLANKNRFELLENDEILEDGIHSILKMNVKPAIFQMQSNNNLNDDDL